MAKVHDIGAQLFWHTLTYPSTEFPLLDRGITHEIDEPFRVGISKVIRLPFTKRALVVGHWKAQLSEGMALQNAIGARALSDTNDDIWGEEF